MKFDSSLITDVSKGGPCRPALGFPPCNAGFYRFTASGTPLLLSLNRYPVAGDAFTFGQIHKKHPVRAGWVRYGGELTASETSDLVATLAVLAEAKLDEFRALANAERTQVLALLGATE